MKTQIHNFMGWWYSCSPSVAMGTWDIQNSRWWFGMNKVTNLLFGASGILVDPPCHVSSAYHFMIIKKSYHHFSFIQQTYKHLSFLWQNPIITFPRAAVMFIALLVLLIYVPGSVICSSVWYVSGTRIRKQQVLLLLRNWTNKNKPWCMKN